MSDNGSPLVLLSGSQIVRAHPNDVAAFSIRADDPQAPRVVRGAVAAVAQVLFEMLSSDINFQGLYINTSWLANADTEWLATNRKRDSRAQMMAIEQAINMAYGPQDRCVVNINGEVAARDAVSFLRALQQNTLQGEPSKRTLMALWKEWPMRGR